ncbi:MAG: RiPP maturation radical SAM C-methyltransferase [Candidatus Omnitrophota bacterium]
MLNPFHNSNERIRSAIGGGDILFIVPPFTSGSPELGPHILQAVARQHGYKADILYLNLLLSSTIGFKSSEKLATSELFQYWIMMNERLFARSAYNLPPLGKSPERCSSEALSISGSNDHRPTDFDAIEPIDLNKYREMEEICYSFVNDVSRIIASLSYKIIGCSSRMGETNCSIALINEIKKIRPDVITLIGGANCYGEMAEGIASLSPSIDYVFCGESENAFIDFLNGFSNGQLPSQRVLSGPLVEDLDSLPSLDYESYFRQLDLFLGEDAPKSTYVWSETSRGCWWGEKKKCTFCGRNNQGIRFRSKSTAKALAELKHIHDTLPNVPVAMSDNIMPFSYYRDLLPALAQSEDYPPICLYYMKANLKLKDLIHLKKARVSKIFPGIESLSTGLLKLFNKGVTARDNLQLLRYASSIGLDLAWFMLWGAPGDRAECYEEILTLLPLIRHLQPPTKLFRIHIERFSAYFDNPSQYRIENLRPWEVYKLIYPEWADIAKLAFEFTGTYPSGADEALPLIKQIAAEIQTWRMVWKTSSLMMLYFAGSYVIVDSRNIPGTPQTHTLDASTAKSVMKYGVYHESPTQKWAIDQKLGVRIDSWYVPLITASPELLEELES